MNVSSCSIDALKIFFNENISCTILKSAVISFNDGRRELRTAWSVTYNNGNEKERIYYIYNGPYKRDRTRKQYFSISIYRTIEHGRLLYGGVEELASLIYALGQRMQHRHQRVTHCTMITIIISSQEEP